MSAKQINTTSHDLTPKSSSVGASPKTYFRLVNYRLFLQINGLFGKLDSPAKNPIVLPLAMLAPLKPYSASWLCEEVLIRSCTSSWLHCQVTLLLNEASAKEPTAASTVNTGSPALLLGKLHARNPRMRKCKRLRSWYSHHLWISMFVAEFGMWHLSTFHQTVASTFWLMISTRSQPYSCG